MSTEIQIYLRTASRDRQGKLTVDPGVTVQELIASAKENWNLAGTYEYIMRCERLGAQLPERSTLLDAGIQDGDVLEIAGLSDAG